MNDHDVNPTLWPIERPRSWIAPCRLRWMVVCALMVACATWPSGVAAQLKIEPSDSEPSDSELGDPELCDPVANSSEVVASSEILVAQPQDRPCRLPLVQPQAKPVRLPQVRSITLPSSLPIPHSSTWFETDRFNRSISTSLASAVMGQSSVSAESQVPPNDSPGQSVGKSFVRSEALEAHKRFDNDFSPTVVPNVSASPVQDSQWVYDSKTDVPTQHPWIEWGRIWYGTGTTPRGLNWFGEKNRIRPEFYLYGDYRTSIASGRNANGRTDNWAHRLNLDMDLRLTGTERFHAFVGPLDNNGQFTRFERIDGDLRFRNEIDFAPLTGFFEGDLGVLIGTFQDRTSPFELPFTIGLVPLLFQNGIWMEDAVTGAAFALPARHSRLFNWANFDATFFVVVDQLNSAAFGTDEHAAQALGTAWFIEAYDGYIETGYAYVRDRNNSQRSYHNLTASFTRRYLDRISNSVRVIVNTGQDFPKATRTADGVLLLVENSWITSSPLTVVPYANFFIGWDRPQSVARAGASGGILRNTGINFDTDGLSGFATLDPTASDTAGGSVGVDLIGDDLDRQLLLEVSYLTPHGNKNANVPDDQFGAGVRYQFPISHATLLRFDTMYGWRRGGLPDVYGTRMEYRWKF